MKAAGITLFVLFVLITGCLILFSVKIVRSTSMEPTLYAGDIVLVTGFFTPRKNHIYGFFHENTLFIKRAMAVEKSLVEIKKGDMYVDHTFTRPGFSFYRTFETTDPIPVPEKHIFFLGDNRIDSYDSRHFGPICYSDVHYRVLLVIFPVDRWGALK